MKGKLILRSPIVDYNAINCGFVYKTVDVDIPFDEEMKQRCNPWGIETWEVTGIEWLEGKKGE